jgi:hypothetical protein
MQDMNKGAVGLCWCHVNLSVSEAQDDFHGSEATTESQPQAPAAFAKTTRKQGLCAYQMLFCSAI